MTTPDTQQEAGWLLDVFVAGRPAPQGSKRHVGGGRMIEMSKHVGLWRDDVRAACLGAWGGRAPLDGPIELDVEFVRRRPASAPKRSTPPATTMPDLSKLVRSTEDAITSAGVWVDDARVVRTVSSKRIAEIGEPPGARIRVRAWTPAATNPRASLAVANYATAPKGVSES
jgi:crossover junction endodeoxyribonuclease RusA